MSFSFNREPALWLGAIQAAIGLAVVVFGVKLSAEQVGSIMAFAAAIGALIVRANVFSPKSKDGDKLVAVQYEGQPPESVK